MKNFTTTIILSLGISTTALASSQVDIQKMIDSFYQENEVAQSLIYCRVDIRAPECRTLMTFKNKQSGRSILSFQMAFSAPLRQAAGTELFILRDKAKGLFYRIVDSTVDGKANGILESADQKVMISHNTIRIQDIKFGTLVANLSFDGNSSVLNGINNGQPVLITYPRLR